MKFFYSIRVVEANSRAEAIEKVENQDFREDVEICDAVLSKTEVLAKVRKLSFKKRNDDFDSLDEPNGKDPDGTTDLGLID